MSALQAGDRQQPDATGPVVVYCRAGRDEWCRDEQGLECTRCRSEISEVVKFLLQPLYMLRAFTRWRILTVTLRLTL